MDTIRRIIQRGTLRLLQPLRALARARGGERCRFNRVLIARVRGSAAADLAANSRRRREEPLRETRTPVHPIPTMATDSRASRPSLLIIQTRRSYARTRARALPERERRFKNERPVLFQART